MCHSDVALRRVARHFSLLIFAAALRAAAAGPSPESLFDLSFEALLAFRISSSTQFDETLQSVPSTVTVIGRDEIRRLGITRLDELMNIVPGYQRYRGIGGSLSALYSSNGRRIQSGREILILLDGMRLNGDIAGGAAGNESAISLENVERVELIRGPGSAIYGSNAFSGVINIVTAGHRELALVVGSYHQREGAAQWRWGQGERQLALMARAAERDGEPLTLYDPVTRTSSPRATRHSKAIFI